VSADICDSVITHRGSAGPRAPITLGSAGPKSQPPLWAAPGIQGLAGEQVPPIPLPRSSPPGSYHLLLRRCRLRRTRLGLRRGLLLLLNCCCLLLHCCLLGHHLLLLLLLLLVIVLHQLLLCWRSLLHHWELGNNQLLSRLWHSWELGYRHRNSGPATGMITATASGKAVTGCSGLETICKGAVENGLLV